MQHKRGPGRPKKTEPEAPKENKTVVLKPMTREQVKAKFKGAPLPGNIYPYGVKRKR